MTQIYNEDCISGAKKHLADNSVDLGIHDPPFGIKEASFDKHYNRKEANVILGYQEAPDDYRQFTYEWMSEAKRVLKDTGSMYVFSGWSNLLHVLEVVKALDLFVINHLVWKYNFGVYTKLKYVSSHYHVLFLKKSEKAKITFNTNCRFTQQEKEGGRDNGRSLLYADMEDVWVINKEYAPGVKKNKNKLPEALVKKILLYSSNQGDVVCDFFMGNFTTAAVASSLNRVPVGFEVNKEAYDEYMKVSV